MELDLIMWTDVICQDEFVFHMKHLNEAIIAIATPYLLIHRLIDRPDNGLFVNFNPNT